MLTRMVCGGWVALVVVGLAAAGVQGAVPGREPGGAMRPNPHDVHLFRLPQVVDLVISADGRYLAAAYSVHAVNRPGTDWQAWVAVWDLAENKRTIIANATRPLAIAPDGQRLAMGLYDRSRNRRGMRPSPEPALWKTMSDTPERTLASDFEPGTFLAWTFSGDGKEVLAINQDATLVKWDVEGEAKGETIEKLSPGQRDEPSPPAPLRSVSSAERAEKTVGEGSRMPVLGQPVDLQAAGNKVVLIAEYQLSEGKDADYAVEVTWFKRANEKWLRATVNPIKRQVPSSVALSHPLVAVGRPYVLSLPAGLAEPLIEAKPARHSRLPTCLAFARKQNIMAYLDPSAALATVRKINGEVLGQFPAAAVHAFTPDGSQLIVSDRRGVLRFWAFESNRIARSLRLDDRPTETFLVAAVQAASQFGEPEANRKTLEEHIRAAAYRGAQVVVLPETAVTGYMSDDLKQTWEVPDRSATVGLRGVDPRDAAETVPGPSTRHFAELARQWGIYLTVPLLEVDRKTEQYYNTDVLLGPDGRILIHYRKLNPWPWAERGWASEGNLGRPVADTPLGRLGVLICFDIHKQAAELAKLKIDTLLYSIAWVEDKDSDWFPKRLPKIAATHGYNIVAANWTMAAVPDEPTWHGYGQSMIIDAAGDVLTTAEEIRDRKEKSPHAQGVIFAELPLPKLE